MVLRDKDSTKILVECDCGCAGISISKFEWHDGVKEYFFMHNITTFSADQHTFLDKFKKRIKMAFYILLKGTYSFNEICMSEENFKEFKGIILTFE